MTRESQFLLYLVLMCAAIAIAFALLGCSTIQPDADANRAIAGVIV